MEEDDDDDEYLFDRASLATMVKKNAN